MPCHVDEIKPNAEKKEISKIVTVNAKTGSIGVLRVGDSFHGRYPTVGSIVTKLRKKFKTFRYKTHGTMIVIVHPCPRKC